MRQEATPTRTGPACWSRWARLSEHRGACEGCCVVTTGLLGAQAPLCRPGLGWVWPCGTPQSPGKRLSAAAKANSSDSELFLPPCDRAGSSSLLREQSMLDMPVLLGPHPLVVTSDCTLWTTIPRVLTWLPGSPAYLEDWTGLRRMWHFGHSTLASPAQDISLLLLLFWSICPCPPLMVDGTEPSSVFCYL